LQIGGIVGTPRLNCAKETENTALGFGGNFDGCFALFPSWRSQKPKIDRQSETSGGTS
jgi:hypothetical protein